MTTIGTPVTLFQSILAGLMMSIEYPAGKIVLVLILAIALIVSYVAIVTLLAALLKGHTARGRKAVATRPWMILVDGLIGWLAFGGLAGFLYSRGMVAAAIVMLVIPALVCLVGAPGLYTHIGERIGALGNKEVSSLRCVVAGCGTALLAVLFPGVGWFIVLPLLLMAEFGAGFQALLRR